MRARHGNLTCRTGTWSWYRTGGRQTGVRSGGFAEPRLGPAAAAKSERSKARCRFHGGKSTGPKTEAGRNCIAEAQHQRWPVYREKVQAGNARESGGGSEGMELSLGTSLHCDTVGWTTSRLQPRHCRPSNRLLRKGIAPWPGMGRGL
jgi:hypothetical protein